MSESMSAEAKAAKRAYNRHYMARWRKENKEKVQEYQRRHWERKAKEMQAEGKGE